MKNKTKLTELRKEMDQQMTEESLLLKELTKAKNTYEWMEQNRFLIPKILEEEIGSIEEQLSRTSMKISRLIKEWDLYH